MPWKPLPFKNEFQLGKLGVRPKRFKKPLSKNARIKKKQQNKKNFTKFINEDLNTPKALGEVWKMLDDKDVSDKEKYALLINFDKVLGLSLDKVRKERIPTEVLKLVKS